MRHMVRVARLETSSNDLRQSMYTPRRSQFAANSMGGTGASNGFPFIPVHAIARTVSRQAAPIVDSVFGKAVEPKSAPLEVDAGCLHEFHERFPEVTLEGPCRFVLTIACSIYLDSQFVGQLYVTTSSIHFFASFFGVRVKETIEFVDITHCLKRSTAFILPNAIYIETIAGRHFYFIIQPQVREQTFTVICNLWKAAVGSRTVEHNAAVSNESIMNDTLISLPSSYQPPACKSYLEDLQLTTHDPAILSAWLPEEGALKFMTSKLCHLPLSVLVELLLCDQIDVYNHFHHQRGEGDVQFREWQPCDSGGDERSCTYIANIKAPIYATQGSRVLEKHRRILYSPERVVLEMTQTFLDVGYKFDIMLRWEMIAVSSDSVSCDHTRIQLYVGVHFGERMWFERQIVKFVQSKCLEAFELLLSISATHQGTLVGDSTSSQEDAVVPVVTPSVADKCTQTKNAVPQGLYISNTMLISLGLILLSSHLLCLKFHT
jgi:hypothetical protein